MIVRLLVFLAAITMLSACSATEEVKQGVEGEVCNDRDLDCRDGHICRLGICVELDGGAYSCADVCDKLQQCNAAGDLESCINQCRAQFEGACETLACPWSDSAIDIYSSCIVDDLSCSELEDASSARDTCFATLPYPEDRAARCETFVDAANACSPDANTPNIELRCSRLARTTTEDSWSRTDACTTRIADGFCAEIEDCLNTIFDINLDLGEGTVDGDVDGDDDPVPAG